MISQLIPLLLLRFKKRRKKTEILILMKSHIITIIKKDIIQILALNKKTSISLGNLCTNN